MHKHLSKALSFNAAEDASIVRHLAAQHKYSLSAEKENQLSHYLSLLAHWNQVHNLTAASTAEQLAEIMLCDAFELASLELPDAKTVIDVGSGAGGPAIPWMLLCPTLHAHLIESQSKRVAFLRMAIGGLALSERLRVSKQRLVANEHSLSSDLACSRATFAPEKWLELAQHIGKRVIVLTTKEIGDQLHTHKKPNMRLQQRKDYLLPFSNSSRSLLLYESFNVCASE